MPDADGKIRALREPDNLCFALLAGTAVSDFADHTDENIRAVDAQTHFDGVIHLGDILNGSIPENASRFVLSQELARFQNATASGKLYIACGDDDGFRNERYVGQIVTGIVTDERWYQETAYLEQYPDLHRPQNKPYYYVDFSERKARLIFLSSYVSQIDEQEELLKKLPIRRGAACVAETGGVGFTCRMDGAGFFPCAAEISV